MIEPCFSGAGVQLRGFSLSIGTLALSLSLSVCLSVSVSLCVPHFTHFDAAPSRVRGGYKFRFMQEAYAQSELQDRASEFHPAVSRGEHVE